MDSTPSISAFPDSGFNVRLAKLEDECKGQTRSIDQLLKLIEKIPVSSPARVSRVEAGLVVRVVTTNESGNRHSAL